MRVPSSKYSPFLPSFTFFQAFLSFVNRSPLFLFDHSKSQFHWYHKQQYKNQAHALMAIALVIGLWSLSERQATSAAPKKSTLPKITTPKPSGLPVRTLQQPLASNDTPQILVNGQTYSLPWTQRTTDQGQRIGLPDGVLKKLFNIEFLSTNDATRQPIGWFRTDSSPSAVLPVLQNVPANPNDRFLDVTDWLKSLGWQVQAQGQQLTLTPPSTNLKELRQPPQPEDKASAQSDRIVLELDRPTSYQIDAQSQEWILRLDAQVKPETIATFKPNPSRKIASLSLKPEAAQTVLKLGIPLSTRPTVTQLNNPPRIIIDIGSIGNTSNYSHDILWQSGIRWRQQMLTIGNETASSVPQPVTVISFELEPRTPGLRLRPFLPNPAEIAGTATLLQTAQQARSIVAINGGFFNRNNQLPLGLIQIGGKVLSGPILNRGVMAWNADGTVEFDRYSLQETATIGAQSFPLTHLNSAYVQAGIARYTPAWGSSYQTLSDGEVIMEVLGDRITSQTPIPTAGTVIPIPSNGYLLTFRSNRTAAASVMIGTPVTLSAVPSNSKVASAFYAIGGGPLLIKDRQIVLDAAAEKFTAAFIKERAARSAIGRLSNGNLLIVSVQPTLGRGGPTLTEMTQIMQQFGAIDALNFDGGSSTTLYLGGLGGQILDRPSRSSARVHNAIGIFRE
jgi:Phosphodiester glycosidase